MSENAILACLRGGLIVTVQANADSVLNTPETIALLARCAQSAGAAGIRAEGVARLAAVRAAVEVPLIGLIKRRYDGFEPYITPTVADALEVIETGCDVVAFDATPRARPDGSDVAALVAAIAQRGAVAMADCATLADAHAAVAAGAPIVATTLAGYTEETRGRMLPAFDLLAETVRIAPFAVCEGGIALPLHAARAFTLGAAAVVVGTAITNIDERVKAFAAAAPAMGRI
jgi:N-acylglucosamine-6-phosphate 2-epimerase